MTALAKTRLKKYRQTRIQARKRFRDELKALTPEQKKEILFQAGVLTKDGKLTAHYRPAKLNGNRQLKR